ncbi:DDE-type integrase/transposase/recombinase [Caulobacter sp. Root1472]|uniref:DDE-type integrase/transposase/recombinase n=1 Tax=Caulobacter sp. Root1472 TaxID=1736470 RepID=UPI001F1B4178|nr:DDE-type integrase/transposase/recombinase [Caulobacter sp. Root1472]
METGPSKFVFHVDEMVCSVGGRRTYLWRAVDDEGEVLDLVPKRRRDTNAALKLLRRLLRHQPADPVSITTDGLGSYTAALKELELIDLDRPGRLREHNRAENSRLPIRRRERKVQASSPGPPPNVSSPPERRSSISCSSSKLIVILPRFSGHPC